MSQLASTERLSSRTTIATIAALIGFAANSLLCRMALGSSAIDAWSFTSIRLSGGALTLFLLVRVRAGKSPNRSSSERAANSSGPTGAPVHSGQKSGGSWGSALALFTYAAAFSLAYLRLSTGVGALVLFACVQATMIGWGIKNGERPTFAEWVGIAIALAGLVLLTLPGAVAPDPIGLALMMLAGIAWGAYSLRGRASRSPLAATADNFARSVPMALVGLAVTFAAWHLTLRGVLLALGSGCIASGLGYSLWYTALPGLRAARAAVVQLVVPVLAAGLGIVLLGEQLSLRLAASGLMILSGVGLALLLRGKKTASAAREITASYPRPRHTPDEPPAR